MAQWREIEHIDQWNEAKEHSGERPVVVLKHSTTCPVSANALEEYEQYLEKNPNTDVDYLLVKVIESRPVSNQIAEDLGVKHASPQIIYFKDGEAIWNASHWAVTAKHMSAVLD
jgi:bacillithiol system protein YtxJ